MGAAGREAFGEAGVFDRSQDGQKQKMSECDGRSRAGYNSLNMLHDIWQGFLKEDL